MNKLIFLFIFSFFVKLSFSQVKLSSSDRDDLKIIEKQLSLQNWVANDSQLESYPICKIKEKYYFSFLGKTNHAFNRESTIEKGIIVSKPLGSIITLKVPVEQLSSLSSLNGIEYAQIAGKVERLLDKAVTDIRADSVHSGIGLPEGYTG